MMSLIQRFFGESLFRNSFYLMASTAVLSLFGFLFWIIAARLFTPEEVGIATALISAASLIATLSLVGCNAALVRFLPQERRPNVLISTIVVLTAGTALAISALFVALIPRISLTLTFVHASSLAGVVFILFCVIGTMSMITDSVYLAHRKAHFIFIINTMWSAARLVFPFLLVSFGALGIFAAIGLAQLIGLLLSVAVLMFFFGVYPARIDMSHMRGLARFSAGTYVASSLNLMPATVLPLIITAHLGPAQSAYYYIALMMANMLYVIPFATTRALFAEGSHAEDNFAAYLKRATQLIAALMLPAIVIVVLLSRPILGIFGAEYAAGGSTILILFALAGIAVSAQSLINAYFLVSKDTGAMIAISAVYAAATLGLSFLFVDFGLTGVGVAWILGNTLAALAGALLYRFPLNATERYKAISYELWVRYSCWRRYRRARRAGRPHKTVLFYPDFPKYYYVHYMICHELGLSMSHDPAKPYDLAFHFQDITTRTEDPFERTLKTKGRLVNAEARDISKEKVEEVFSDIFGYGMKIDPRTFVGECVQKSNENATHDGTVVRCPREPEEGYIYQKLINNRDGDRVSDIRVKVVDDSIPFVIYRTRSAFDRFDNTQTAEMVPIDEYLSTDEQEKILLFCKKMGIEFGALDCLRDRDDGRLYIVDANLTTGTPRPGVHFTFNEYEEYIQKFSAAFDRAFMSGDRISRHTSRQASDIPPIRSTRV